MPSSAADCPYRLVSVSYTHLDVYKRQDLGGFATISDAARALQPKVKQVYTPDPTATTTYGAVYKIWKDLHDLSLIHI